MEHYKRSGREEVDRYIAKIKRDKKKQREAAIAAAAQVASSSEDQGKKRAREPSTEEESEEEEEQIEEEDEDEEESEEDEKRPNKRTPFVDKDFDRLVRYLASAEDQNKTKGAAYANLARDVSRSPYLCLSPSYSLTMLPLALPVPRPHGVVLAELSPRPQEISR